MIQRTKILEKLTNKRLKDYSFTIGFFLVFSFFIIFLIRPNLITAFNLQKELDQLHTVDQGYENAILHIIELQNFIEANRDNFYLLDDAFPSTAQANKLIQDVTNDASQSGLIISKADIGQLNLKEDKGSNNRKQYVLSLEINGPFDSIDKFITTLSAQRRIKNIKNLSIERDVGVSSTSGQLKMNVEVVTYYL